MIKILYIGNQSTIKGITTTTIDSLSKKLERENYNVKTASKKSNKILRILDMVGLVLSNIRRTNYVLIDTYSTQNFYYALIISQICKIFKLKYIPILHGGNLPNRLNNNPKLSKLIFSNAYTNVSPSKYLMKAFKDFGFENVCYIPNSIEIENYPVIPKKKEKLKLLWVRSLAKIYNPKMAIEVLNELKKRGYEAELCMVGPDKELLLTGLESLASDYKVKVKFTGKLTQSEWIELSKNYNVFVNTTNFDNMPVSVIEAMALAFPVISTNVGGLSFLLDDGNNALLVNANDVENMANKIIELIEDPKLVNKLTLNARKKAENFDWQIVKQKWKELLI